MATQSKNVDLPAEIFDVAVVLVQGAHFEASSSVVLVAEEPFTKAS